MRLRLAIGAACLGLATCVAAQQSYPNKPIRIIVGYSAGGGNDIIVRVVAYAKARPDQANYAASATPFQLASELFNQKAGTKFAYIPYKGSGDSVGAVMSGQVTMTIMDPPPAIGPLKSGKARGLAVTSARRHPNWPQLPTLAEAGVPDFEIRLFTGFLAPAGTPPAIVRRLQREVARVVRLPEIKEQLDQMAIDPSGNTPEEFRRIIARDIKKWTAVAKAANIKA